MIILTAVICLPVLSQAGKTKISSGNIYPGDLSVRAFSANRDTHVTINGSLGVFYERGNEIVFYGWIVDSNTRKVVWHMLETKSRRTKNVRAIEEKLDLPKGDYEIYYAGELNNSRQIGRKHYRNVISQVVSAVFRSRNEYLDRYRDELFMSVEGDKNVLKETDPEEIMKRITRNTIVSFSRTDDHSNLRQSFSVSDDINVRIYALGEVTRDSLYDYGWIENMNTGERIWSMSYRQSVHAGGGRKNRLVNKNITLPPGNYTVHYSSDDTHSFEEWNTLPPDDPQFWGISLFVESPGDLKKIKSIENSAVPAPVIALTRVGDDEFVTRMIRVTKKTPVRILCMGEAPGSRDLCDYGWISSVKTGEKLWEFSYEDSIPAGGSSKNRVDNDVIDIEPGDYEVIYTTDGSHSYSHWNASPPYDEELWGITIWPVNPADRDNIKPVKSSEVEGKSVLAQIIRVKKRRNLKKTFSLKDDTKINIFGIGEGDRDELYDYGWIERKSTGKIVWEMTPRNTEHAGGARKNRMFRGSIILEKGEYELRYVTDGSHSFMDWNATPPGDPHRYGITLTVAE